MGEYSIAIVGLGDVGQEIAKSIARMSLPRSSRLSKIYVCSRDIEKARTFARNVLGPINPRTPVLKYGITLEGLLDANPDIVINVAAVESAKYESDRKVMGRKNLELNRKICANVHEKSLYLIVTNHVGMLCKDSVISCGRNPMRTAGITHTDTIRGRNGFDIEYRRIEEHQHLPFNLEDLWVIGSHDKGGMIVATKALANNVRIEDLGFLKDKIKEIESAIEKAGPEQKELLGSTKDDTALAVEATVRAAITGKGKVTAAVFCDFSDKFFKNDPDYNSLRKPLRGQYMSLPVSFKDLQVQMPDLKWFAKQEKEVKKRFYEVALEQQEFIDSLREEGRIKGYVCLKRKTESTDAKKIIPGEFSAVYVAAGPFICTVKKEVSEFTSLLENLSKQNSIESDIRRVGFVDGKFYATFRKSILLNGEEIPWTLDYAKRRGINSLESLNGKIYATHYDLGVFVSEGKKLKRIFADPARSLVKDDDRLFFVSKTRIYDPKIDLPVYEKNSGDSEELTGLVKSPEAIIAFEESGTVTMLEREGSSLRLIAARTLEEEMKKTGAGRISCATSFGEEIAFGTNSGVISYDPAKDCCQILRPRGKIRAIACKNGNLFAASSYSLMHINSGKELKLPPEITMHGIMDICID